MDAFVAKHEQSIRGVLSCFDRVLFRGDVPLMSGWAMAECLQRKQVQRRTLKAFLLAAAAVKQSGQVTRLLRRLHIHHVIAKMPRSRRWRVSRNGRRVMAAAVKLREGAYPSLYAEAA